MRQLDFIGIGTPKCGTTWLAECLEQHPQINMPKREFKYFTLNYQEDLSGYKEYFEDIPQNMKAGEFSSGYILDSEAMHRIAAVYPKVKTIIVMRNPVDRAVSQFQYFHYNVKRENTYSFKKALDSATSYHYTIKGLYAKHLKHVYDLFPKEQVFIILYDEIKSDPGTVLRNLYRYLGVDETFVPSKIAKVVNATQSGKELMPHAYLTLNKWRAERYCKGAVSRLALRVITKLYRVSMPLLKLAKLTENKNKVVVEPEALDRIYTEYFKADIEELERITGINLNSWKRNTQRKAVAKQEPSQVQMAATK